MLRMTFATAGRASKNNAVGDFRIVNVNVAVYRSQARLAEREHCGNPDAIGLWLPHGSLT